jgi:hypothetical protein
MHHTSLVDTLQCSMPNQTFTLDSLAVHLMNAEQALQLPNLSQLSIELELPMFRPVERAAFKLVRCIVDFLEDLSHLRDFGMSVLVALLQRRKDIAQQRLELVAVLEVTPNKMKRCSCVFWCALV